MMKEYDVVTLVKPFENLKENTSGTIVLKYDDNNFEVEFFDKNGETIGVYTVTSDYLSADNT